MIKKETKLAAQRLVNNPKVKDFLAKHLGYEFRLDSNIVGLRLELTHIQDGTVKTSLFLGKNKEAQTILEKIHEFLWLLEK